MTTTQLPEFDVFTLSSVADPYPMYAEWRRQGALIKAGPAQWGVTRHADVSALLRDRRLSHAMPKDYTDFILGAGATSEFRQNSLLMREGPVHQRLRRLIAQAFTPRLVAELRQRVQSLVDGMLQPLVDGEASNFVELVAFPLPTTVVCELLGITGVDRDEVRRWSFQMFSPDPATSDAAVIWLRSYMAAVLLDRAADPEGDLLERMLAAEDGEGALTHDEIVDNAMLLFFAGFETTRHLISAGTVALLAFPDQWRRLQHEPDLSLVAVEEFLRYDGPVRFIGCMTLEPVEVGGRTIGEGRVLQLLLGSANHDEDVFEDPERLDIGRAPNPHVSFGGGPHRCLGMHLARLEGDVVFGTLARRMATLEPAGAPTREFGGFTTWSDVPVRGRAR